MILIVVITMTAGTALIMWMGELITQRGIGNGMSLIIFVSIVSQLPSARSPSSCWVNTSEYGFGYVSVRRGRWVLMLALTVGHRLHGPRPETDP